MKHTISGENKIYMDMVNDKMYENGWGIFYAYGFDSLGYSVEGYRIETFDELKKFKNDTEAIKHVIQQASIGSELEQGAIKFMIENGTHAELQRILTTITE